MHASITTAGFLGLTAAFAREGVGGWVLELHLTGMLVQAFVMCRKHFALDNMLGFLYMFLFVCNTVNPLFTAGMILHKTSSSDSQQFVPRGLEVASAVTVV